MYTVYRTINDLTGRYYIGVHKTDNPNDDYLGSGLLIKRAVKKYGVKHFTKEIMFCYDNLTEALDKESELVSAHQGDPLCYNLHEGGFGGFDNINSRGLNNKNNNNRAANEARVFRMKTDPEFRARMVEFSHKGYEKAKLNPRFSDCSQLRLNSMREKAVKAWAGCSHSEDARRKMREAHEGEKNSRYGCRWMYHPILGNKSVIPYEINEHLLAGWAFGRKPGKVAER